MNNYIYSLNDITICFYNETFPFEFKTQLNRIFYFNTRNYAISVYSHLIERLVYRLCTI